MCKIHLEKFIKCSRDIKEDLNKRREIGFMDGMTKCFKDDN